MFCSPLCLAAAVTLLGVPGSYQNPHRAPPAKIPTDAGPKEWAAFMDVWGPRPPWHVYRTPHRTVEQLGWHGTVLKVSDRFIEIERQVDGKPIRYPAHFLLATGRVLAWEMDCMCYLLQDVQKGDEVVVGVGTEDEKRGEECFFVVIHRRPGGKIPPSRKPSTVHPYHVERQAKIDVIEKGTPLPDHMRNERIPPLKPVKPVAPPPKEEPPAEKKSPVAIPPTPANQEPRRPTTKEEFAALAKEGPRPPWMPFISQKRVEHDYVHGTVVAVSRKVIEIQLKGKKETAKYQPHTLLDTGAVCHWEADCFCYLLDDVQQGDAVVLGVGTVDKEKGPECFTVMIDERPGGAVPASRKPSYPKPYHVRRQNEINVALNSISQKEKQPDPPAEKKSPAAKPPTPAKEEKKRPTTVEEFAELAKNAPKPPWLPFRGQNRVRDEMIDGTVVSVSREAIEILPVGKKEAVKYPPHTLLDTGAVCHWENDAHCYLLDDVQKGDVVLIGVGITEPGGETQCFYVRIRKRPGGVVPASRKPSSYPAYHHNQQAKIDHEEKGTPLPDHLREKSGDPGDPPPKKKTPVTPPVGDPPMKKD